MQRWSIAILWGGAFCLAGAGLAGAMLMKGAPAPSGPPTLADLQAAYDSEAQLAGPLHDKDLKIVGLECHPGSAPSRFYCEVGFVKSQLDPDRVFLDAAEVERRGPGSWKLLSGLCRRLI